MKKIFLLLACTLTIVFFAKAQVLYTTTFFGGAGGGGTITKYDAATQLLSAAYSFELSGRYPLRSNLIQTIDGKLYGMTNSGGSNNAGVIFSYDPVSSTYSKLKDFSSTDGTYPIGSLMQASDGKLYGMTQHGGSNNAGVIFSYEPGTSTYTKLKDFGSTDGANPFGSLIQTTDGKLYGMTYQGGSNNAGVIFSYDPVSSTYSKLKDFSSTDGTYPIGSLMQASDGKLYGMTYQGGSNNYGVIFSYEPGTSTYSKLKDFSSTDGTYPLGSLMRASDGKLYGMTAYGGSNSFGVIFSYDPVSSTYSKLKDFSSTDGVNPQGSLMRASDGKLYGMTAYGGSNSFGVIFSYDPVSSTYSKLKDFSSTDGVNPQGSLMQASDGKLYGMTYQGGSSGFGVIFSYDPVSSTYTKLKDFSSTDGVNPQGSLMQATDDKLYGMTYQGGSNNVGVIFSYDPVSSTYSKLKDFSSTDGVNPQGSLMQATDGKLYGITYGGGSNNAGVIFSYDPGTSTYSKLKDFSSTDGTYPLGSLMQASDGKLYGMTAYGGSNGVGVIFSYDPVSSTYSKLKDFSNADGVNPQGSLMQASDGKLYGMTFQGGSNGVGVIFSYDPGTSTYSSLKNFSVTDGIYPKGSLMQASDGKLYGMTYQGGSNNVGVIFSYDPGTSTYTRLKDFSSTDGTNPQGSLMQASDGKLYGMTSQGGSKGMGVAFSFDIPGSVYTKLQDFNGANGNYPSYTSFIEICTPHTYYKDNDGDGFGDANNSTSSCSSTPPSGYTADNTDCNDNDAAIHQQFSFYPDTDGDGFGAGAAVMVCAVDANTPPSGYSINNTDCNDTDAEIHAPFTYYRDADGDGFGDPNNTTTVCSLGPPVGYVTNSSDCDDTKLLFADNDGDGYGAGLPVACGVDNYSDCNDNDAGAHSFITYYRDLDHDGFGDPNNTTAACSSIPPAGYVNNNNDCDDTKLLYADNDGDGYGAGSPVACGVAYNTDCNDADASVHSPIVYYLDLDHDGFGDPNQIRYSCSLVPPEGCVNNKSDCNDADASVHSPQTYYADNDGDGFGDANVTTTVCSSTAPAGYVTNSSDCDDTKLLYADNDGDGYGAGSPVACGVANNTDCNDADATVHSQQTYYADNDGDGFGDANNSIGTCSSIPPSGYVTNSSDCDDSKLLYADNDGDGYGAGAAVACGVANNTDCNDADASVHSSQTYYADNDGDGFGDANVTTNVCSSTPPTGYVTNSSDCDDTKLLYADNDGDGYGAGAAVACGVANNTDCNDADATVHSQQTYYADNDGDGFGDANVTTTVCSSTAPAGYVTNSSDCDDTKLLYADNDGDGYGAGAAVACGVANNTDCNDADATVHSQQTYYADNDGDGFGDANNSIGTCSSIPPSGYVTNSSDCDDTKLLYADNDGDGYGAGAAVACGVANNTDCNDADATVHTGITYYRDADGDGFGDANVTTTVCSSTAPAGYVTNSSDCDDTKLLYADNDGDGYGAGTAVACGVADNSDCNDADASVHTGITYYRDADGDGFGDLNVTTTVCSSTAPTGYVTNSSDCDDTKLLYADNDGDGYGAGAAVACGVANNTDCNDNNASVHPGATEICGNGIDDNCNGTIDEDVIAPVVTSSPSNIIVNNDPGVCGAKVDFSLPTATDNCGCTTPGNIAGYTLLGSYSGHKYFISTNTMNWTSAKAMASSLGGHLVTVGSVGEQNFLQTATTTQAWIGFTDENNEGSFSWVTNEPVAYTNWSSGEPNNAGGIEDYTIINWYLGSWNDLSNGYNFPFIVEFDCDGSNGVTITQTSGLPSGSIFPIGVTTNSFNLTDGSGNIATCSFTVTVNTATVWYKDADNDGYSDGTTQTQCSRPSGYKLSTELTQISGDCDDNDAAINPTTVWYKDADNDGYSDGVTQTQCTRPSDYKLSTELTQISGDCNDNDASVHTGITYYRDADGDGFGDLNVTTTVCSSTAPTGYVTNSSDCDDTKLLYADNDGDGFGAGPAVACGVANNTDCNDADASVHTGITYYRDADGDGFGDLNVTTTVCSSTPPVGYVTNSSDCDDTKLLYADNDGDGYGAGPAVACGVANNTDCNDNNANVHPGATEICGNGIDDNCNGQIDEGCTSAPVQISIADNSITEGNKGTKTMNFVVTLNKASTKPIIVFYLTQHLTASAGSDYQSQAGTIVFAPGKTSATIGIKVKGDTKVEPDETFQVVLFYAINASIADNAGIGTIINDDGASVSSKMVTQTTMETSVRLFPNPAQTSATVSITGAIGGINVWLMDLNGRVLWKKEKILDNTVQIPLDKLADGTYFVTVKDEQTTKTLKLIKSR